MPTSWDANVSEVAESVIAGVVVPDPDDCGEVPDRLTSWSGRPEPFSTNSVVVVVPVDAGLKATLNEQESPGARVGPQVKVSGKIDLDDESIPKPTPFRVAFPVLVSVIVCGADSVPSS